MTASFKQDAINVRERLDILDQHHHDEEYSPMMRFGKNYLINGDRTVGQRRDFSISAGAVNNQYVIDRWYIGLANSTVNCYKESGKTLTGADIFRAQVASVTSDGLVQIIQLIENWEFFAGRTITITAEIKSNVPANIVCGYAAGKNIRSKVLPGDGAWNTVSMTLTLPVLASMEKLQVQTSTWLGDHVPQEVGDYIAVGNIQLELGDKFTGFEIVHPVDQLARCKRYYEKIPSVGVPNHRIIIGQAVTGTNGYFNLSFSPKRTVPTVTASAPGDFQVMSANNSSHAVSAISFAFGDNSGILTNATTSASLIAGNATQLVCANANTAIYIDAEM